MTKTIYLNLEDDVTRVVNKLKREKASSVVLVFPKQSFIFGDKINLRLLKKQLDMLGKEVSILTMDERGRGFAQEAGFAIKSMPRAVRSHSLSDIRMRTAPVPETVVRSTAVVEPEPEPLPQSLAETPRVSLSRRKIVPAPAKAIPQRLTRRTGAVKKITSAGAPAAVAYSDLPPVTAKDNVYMPPNSHSFRPPRRRSYVGYAVGFIVLAITVSLLLVFLVLPSASVAVYAGADQISRDLDVLANVNVESAQSTNLTIPAVSVAESRSTAETFSVNGKKELGNKAEGRVAIYNLTGQPMSLRAGTTTLTIGNKSYVFKQDQNNVRAVSSANDTEATVADIIAIDGGESFNAPAGTRMEITNQAFGSQPQRLFAKTITQVIGGSSRFVSVVTKEDLDAAQRELVKRAVEDINSSLSGNVRLVEGAFTVNVESFTPDQPEGAEVQNFSAQLKVNISGLAFDESTLKNLIRQRLLTTLGTGKELQSQDKDKIIYQIKNLDTQNGLMQLSLNYETFSRPVLNADTLKNQIAGKSKQEASDLILANPEIDRVEITVQPVWQSDLPRFSGKINLEIKE